MAIYEQITAEDILQRMLDRVPTNVDKRVGSLIYNALMPASAEMKQMLIELDAVLNQTFADHADREFLIRRCAERGVKPLDATPAVLRGAFNVPIAIGSRFTAGNYVIKAVEALGANEYRMEAETPGAGANSLIGPIVPVSYIDGMASAQLTELLIPGSDSEDTEILRARYFASFQDQPFGGNVSDYKAKVNSLPGVGGCKVARTPAGGGTVGIVIINSSHSVPSPTLIDDVQTALDPVANAGDGLGIAPIGHVVTVTGVTGVTINIATTVTFAPGWDWPALEPYVIEVIDEYFLDLRQGWQNSAQIIIRIAQLDSKLLNLTGVVDIEGTTLNGEAVNKVLTDSQIPERGAVNG
jgi:uncharacterized phage protein gp47/JayE